MKRLIFLGITFLTFLSASAQDEADFKKFKFGFNVAPNLSWMSPKTTDITNEGILLRGTYGLTADIMFSDRYAFGTGISVMGSGGQLSFFQEVTRTRDTGDEFFIASVDRKYRLKFVEIPLTIKLRTDEIGYITYWGQFGMGLGFATKALADETIKLRTQLIPDATVPDAATWIDDGNGITIDKADIEEEGIDISGDIRPIRASLIVGAGIDYNLSGNTSLMFGISYNNGFTNVFRSDEEAIAPNDDGNPTFREDPTARGGRAYETFEQRAITNSFVITAGILF